MSSLYQKVLAVLLCSCAACANGVDIPAEVVLPLHEARDAYTPAAAWGGDSFLVTWQSGLTAPGALRKGPKYIGDIAGCRVDRAGKVLDGKPFVICGAGDAQERPRVAWGRADGCFLVVWQDIRNGKDWDVYAARVGADGKVMDKDGFLVCGGEHNQAKPRVTWDGKTFVVVWQDFRSGTQPDVYAARINRNGEVLDKDGVLIDDRAYYPEITSAADGKSFVSVITLKGPTTPALVQVGLGFFFSEGKASPVLSTPWERDRGPLEAAPTVGFGPVSMAAGGDSYLMMWKTFTPFSRGWPGAYRLQAKGMKAFDGLVLTGKAERKTALQLFGKHEDLRIVDPDTAWDGSGFTVAWHETLSMAKNSGYNYDSVFLARVGIDGVAAGEVTNVCGTAEAPAREVCIASDGAGLVLLGYEKCPSSGDVPVQIGIRVFAQQKLSGAR